MLYVIRASENSHREKYNYEKSLTVFNNYGQTTRSTSHKESEILN